MSSELESGFVHLNVGARCSADEIPRMMCRVVKYMKYPLMRFEPIEEFSNLDGAPPLPKPRRITNVDTLISNMSATSGKCSMSKLFNFGGGVTQKDKEKLKTGEVLIYTLNNADSYFKKLLTHAVYEQPVRDLVQQPRDKNKGYLVVAFLTTKNATRSQEGSSQTNFNVEATAPVSQAAGVPPVLGAAGSALDLSSQIEASSTMDSNTGYEAPDEEIFAVKYLPVKFKKQMQVDWDIADMMRTGDVDMLEDLPDLPLASHSEDMSEDVRPSFDIFRVNENVFVPEHLLARSSEDKSEDVPPPPSISLKERFIWVLSMLAPCGLLSGWIEHDDQEDKDAEEGDFLDLGEDDVKDDEDFKKFLAKESFGF